MIVCSATLHSIEVKKLAVRKHDLFNIDILVAIPKPNTIFLIGKKPSLFWIRKFPVYFELEMYFESEISRLTASEKAMANTMNAWF
jgi:hypothetical protein